MSNTATRTVLRRIAARPEPGRTRYNAARASLVAAAGEAPAPYSTRSICQRCLRPFLICPPPSSQLSLQHGVRALHGTPIVHKSSREPKADVKAKRKDGKPNRSGEPTESSSNKSKSNSGGNADDGPKHPQPSPDEPLDFADVESRLRKHAEHFRAVFKKLHAAGRFDADAIGGLRVAVDKKAGLAYPLRELAQVVPRGGRAVSLLVHDAEYVKPIMSAVQASADFNQQPQRDPDNELELVLKIEPEKREDLVRRVKASAHEWRERVRAVRQKRDKLHATWKKDGSLGPDLKRTVDKELDKIIKAAVTEIDAAEKDAIKHAESK
ncbi:ribosome recycling factor [Xylariaceae sp. FL1651]|nr:ribosome recycling factor [Xylariaceae sp. FL1651]